MQNSTMLHLRHQNYKCQLLIRKVNQNIIRLKQFLLKMEKDIPQQDQINFFQHQIPHFKSETLTSLINMTKTNCLLCKQAYETFEYKVSNCITQPKQAFLICSSNHTVCRECLLKNNKKQCPEPKCRGQYIGKYKERKHLSWSQWQKLLMIAQEQIENHVQQQLRHLNPEQNKKIKAEEPLDVAHSIQSLSSIREYSQKSNSSVDVILKFLERSIERSNHILKVQKQQYDLYNSRLNYGESVLLSNKLSDRKIQELTQALERAEKLKENFVSMYQEILQNLIKKDSFENGETDIRKFMNKKIKGQAAYIYNQSKQKQELAQENKKKEATIKQMSILLQEAQTEIAKNNEQKQQMILKQLEMEQNINDQTLIIKAKQKQDHFKSENIKQLKTELTANVNKIERMTQHWHSFKKKVASKRLDYDRYTDFLFVIVNMAFFSCQLAFVCLYAHEFLFSSEQFSMVQLIGFFMVFGSTLGVWFILLVGGFIFFLCEIFKVINESILAIFTSRLKYFFWFILSIFFVLLLTFYPIIGVVRLRPLIRSDSLISKLNKIRSFLYFYICMVIFILAGFIIFSLSISASNSRQSPFNSLSYVGIIFGILAEMTSVQQLIRINRQKQEMEVIDQSQYIDLEDQIVLIAPIINRRINEQIQIMN